MVLWKKILLWIAGSLLYIAIGLYVTKYVLPPLIGVSIQYNADVLNQNQAFLLFSIIFWPLFLIGRGVELIFNFFSPVLLWMFSHI